MISPVLESSSVYLKFSHAGLSMNMFNNIVSSPHQIVCNWPRVVMNHVLNMDKNTDNYTHSYSQESNFNEGYNYFDDLVV